MYKALGELGLTTYTSHGVNRVKTNVRTFEMCFEMLIKSIRMSSVKANVRYFVCFALNLMCVALNDLRQGYCTSSEPLVSKLLYEYLSELHQS